MKKIILFLLYFLIITTGLPVFASNSADAIRLKAKSCFMLLSKKRDKLSLEDINGAEEYLRKKMEKSKEIKNIIREVYMEETNRLSDRVSVEYNETELQNLRISGVRLGFEQIEPVELFTVETDSDKSRAYLYRGNSKCNIF